MKTTKDDKDLFKEAMKQVRPLRARTSKHLSKPNKSVARTTIKRTKAAPVSSKTFPTLSDHVGDHMVSGSQLLFYNVPGVSQRILRKLKRGQFECEQELDLHGKTSDEARDLVVHFLQDAQNMGCSCVRIIHGKGYSTMSDKPKLKNLINQWLRQLSFVLAFCSAQSKDGGSGAVNILLKKN